MVLEWIQAQGATFWLMTVGSLGIFIGTVIAIPLFIRRLPTDYLIRKQLSSSNSPRTFSTRSILSRILKNLLGATCIVAGLVMLVLPGQGLLTILVGVMLMDFPGKFTLERCFLLYPPVLRTVNWIRARANQPALQIPTKEVAAHGNSPP